MIDRAIERRQLPAGTDPDEVIRHVGAPLYYRLLVLGEPVTPQSPTSPRPSPPRRHTPERSRDGIEGAVWALVVPCCERTRRSSSSLRPVCGARDRTAWEQRPDPVLRLTAAGRT
jgi:hypothetical protein